MADSSHNIPTTTHQYNNVGTLVESRQPAARYLGQLHRGKIWKSKVSLAARAPSTAPASRPAQHILLAAPVRVRVRVRVRVGVRVRVRGRVRVRVRVGVRARVRVRVIGRT